jgi:hypothetical protein
MFESFGFNWKLIVKKLTATLKINPEIALSTPNNWCEFSLISYQF